MKKIAIFGSTGSIGKNAIEVIKLYPDKFKVHTLSTYHNYEILINQIEELKPKYAIIVKEPYREIKEKLEKIAKKENVEICYGSKCLEDLAGENEIDIVLLSIVGIAGLPPFISALKAGKTIALANKEALVTGGELAKRLLNKYKGKIIPVDSEHSAIFQCIQGKLNSKPEKIILTASGGPFYYKNVDLSKVTPEQALKHPNWNMGAKITIDSATLMNKGLEVIEAHHLFNMSYKNIEVCIHPESIIHSMVEFCDGAVLAQLGLPDMKLPIMLALSYPERLPLPYKRLNLFEIKRLTFDKPDMVRFPCLRLAYEAIKEGKSMPIVLNASNEVAVDAFLKHKIKFSQIPELIEYCMNAHQVVNIENLYDILEIDKQTKSLANKWITNHS